MKKSFQKASRRTDGLPYNHRLGQHFLHDQCLLEDLVAATGITRQDHVLEIGPGSGMLTACLCRAAAQVLAVEVDETLLPLLRVSLAAYPNFTLVHGDIRRLRLAELCAPLGQGFFVIANIPYNITSPILDLFIGNALPVRQLSVMVQQEVADKLLAAPGDPGYGPLSLRAQFYCHPALVCAVPAQAFTPPPKVDSAFVNLPFRQEPPYPTADPKLLFQLIKGSFTQRRKTLTNALKGVLPPAISPSFLHQALEALSLSPTVRGEALSLQEWILLANAVAAQCGTPLYS